MSLRRLIALMLLGVALGGCALAGRTFGRYYDDRTITGSVKHGLIRGLPVNVDTYEGTVYLSGDVDTATQKSDAEAAAWRVEGVEQVVNDVRVRDTGAPSASPSMVGASPGLLTSSLLLQRLPGLLRIDPAQPREGAEAYDRSGALVATVYVRPLREVGLTGFDEMVPTLRPITHVSLYPVPVSAEQPEALVTIVLWHISRAAAAALK